jgi:hypothetical protein
MLDYSWTFIFKCYCVGALNGWQTVWEDSDHGNQFIRIPQKDIPSICYALSQASTAAGLYCKAVSGVNKDLENVMASKLIFTCFLLPATRNANYVDR